MTVQVRDMQVGDEEYAGPCTHCHESTELTTSGRRRTAWFRDRWERGARVKIALLDGKHAGILHVMPIEICPWGLVGQDMTIITCLVAGQRKGIGRALIDAAIAETLCLGRKAVSTVAYYGESPFMPAPFFEKCGFSVVARLDDPGKSAMPVVPLDAAILWKTLSDSAHPPTFLQRTYRFEDVPGKVVVDLFWSGCCMAMDVEAQRVRQVAKEFGEAVILREHCSDNPEVRQQFGVVRGILVDGTDVCWGGATPKEAISGAIHEALTREANKPDARDG